MIYYAFGVKMDKEKVINIIILIVLAVALILLSIFLYNNYSKGQGAISLKIEFNELCTQWNYDKCTNYALQLIDARQQNAEKPTLTELCMKTYYMENDDKTIRHCKDICMNRCSPKLYYDLAVYPGSIRFTENTIEIKIYNLGSGTAYDAYITASEGANILQDWHIDIGSYDTKTLVFEPENKIDYIYVEIEYADSNTKNNNAEKERL